MQSVGTDQYNTFNSQQPHNHPTPQSPPGLCSASSGFNSSMSSNMAKITSPQNNPPIIAPSHSLPTPRSPTVDAHLTADSDDINDEMDIESGSDPSRKRRRGPMDDGDDDRPRKSRSRSRDPNNMDIDQEQSKDLLVAPVQRSLRTIPTVQELLDMPSTGPPSWLNQTKHYPAKPALTSSLIEVYALQSIAASVARADPVTGEKKKLRKSYKGKIAGLSGKNEVVTTQQQMVVPEGQEGWGQPMPQLVKGGLLEMLDIPDEEWRNQKVIGKEMPKPGVPGGKQLDLNALRKGFSNWSKGPIPDYDASWLAIDDPPTRSSSIAHHSTPTFTNNQKMAMKTGTPAVSSTPNGVNTTSPEHREPRGVVSRKRGRELENGSWMGYGEEYDDETGSGYDDEGRKKKKKKRKYDEPIGGLGMNNIPVSHAVGVGVGGGGYYQR